VKRYVREAGSDLVRGWLASGTSATSRLSEVEIASALMRRWREGAFDARGRDRALQALSRDFGALSVVEIGPSITARARVLLERHPLRAGDALQLASCLLLRDTSAGPVAFAAFDDRLNQAARAEGLQPPSASPSRRD
jgi:predicted nucleic acid-binding protein